jgi:hypothetical protein
VCALAGQYLLPPARNSASFNSLCSARALRFPPFDPKQFITCPKVAGTSRGLQVLERPLLIFGHVNVVQETSWGAGRRRRWCCCMRATGFQRGGPVAYQLAVVLASLGRVAGGAGLVGEGVCARS